MPLTLFYAQLFPLLLIAGNVNALPVFPAKCLIQPTFENKVDQLHRVVMIGEESRKVIPAAMEKQFASTGIINCGSSSQTAQVTGAKNVISTAAHLFYDDNCQPKNNLDCKYHSTVNGKYMAYPINTNSLKMGKCPKNGDQDQDWAVLKLSEPVTNVEPYSIPDRDNLLIEGEKIMQISGYAKNFLRNQEFPKNMQSCRARDFNVTVGYPIQHDCDTGKGSSGSAQFVVRGKKMIFASMNVSETRVSETGEYDKNTHFNISTPVSGDFLKAIRDAMKSP